MPAREIVRSTFSGTPQLITVWAQAPHTCRSDQTRPSAKSLTRTCPTTLVSARLRPRRPVLRSRRRKGLSDPFHPEHDRRRIIGVYRAHLNIQRGSRKASALSRFPFCLPVLRSSAFDG